MGISIVAAALAPAPIPAPPAADLDVRWQAPPGCGSANEVQSTAREFASADIPPPMLERVHVEASVESGGGSTVVDIRVTTPLGVMEREVEADSCAAAVDAAAVVIAVALDPLTVVQTIRATPRGPPDPVPPPSMEPGPRPDSQPEPTPTRSADPPARPAEPRARTPRAPGGAIRVAGLVDRGSLNGTTGGPRLTSALTLGRARVEIGGTYLAAREVRPFDEPGDPGVRIQLGEVSAQGCFVPTVSRVEFPTCAGFALGAMRGDGVDLARPSTNYDLWAAATVSAGVGWSASPHFGLWLQAEGLATLYRPAFVIDDLGTAFRAGPAAIRAMLGPEVRFP